MTNEIQEPTLQVFVMPTVDTWRYQGDRVVADGIYCTRFNVQVAPEPFAMAGGVWAYTLPVPLSVG